MKLTEMHNLFWMLDATVYFQLIKSSTKIEFEALALHVCHPCGGTFKAPLQNVTFTLLILELPCNSLVILSKYSFTPCSQKMLIRGHCLAVRGWGGGVSQNLKLTQFSNITLEIVDS